MTSPGVSGGPQAQAPHTTYSRLVQSDADMTGHVAYALYKRDKLKFCESIDASEQRPVEARELEIFIRSANLPTRIDAYRTEAEKALRDFAQEVLNGQLVELDHEYQAKLAAELKAARSFWRSVGENLVANLLAIAVTALLLLIIYGTRIGFAPLLGDVFGYDIKERPAQTSPAK